MPKSFHNPHEYNAEYILIPGGRYKYSVTGQIEPVPDIYFAKYPVTNKRYRRFIRYLDNQEPELHKMLPAARFCDLLSGFLSSVDYSGPFKAEWADDLRSGMDEHWPFEGDDQPVVDVSWFAARAYCLWLTELARRSANSWVSQAPGVFGIPKEVEWEWAASGGRREYPWGDEEPDGKRANYRQNVTTPVGRYPDGATPEGLMDMGGNVWEWMENWHDENWSTRSLRGGSWYNVANVLRCSYRGKNFPHCHDEYVGFRVVRSQS